MRIGIDLGGTKIEALALADDGQELLRQRLPTPRDYEESLDTVARLVSSFEDELGWRATIGVGMPGAISPATGLVKNANSTWLNGRPLREDLQARLGRELRFENDANCFALSEAVDGAGAGADCVFGVILGTGTGGGLVLHGAIWSGRNALAGEWGHTRCRRRGPTSCRARPATAAGRGASRPSSRGRGWPATTRPAPARRSTRSSSRPRRPPAAARRSRPSRATRSAWRGRWPA